MFYILNPISRLRALEAVKTMPDGWRVKVDQPTRNLEQNAALHARIGEIAERMTWAGKRWDIETWKRLLVGAWSRAKGEGVVMLPALDGAGVEIVFRRTSSLTKSECSELLEYINAWAADQPEMHDA